MIERARPFGTTWQKAHELASSAGHPQVIIDLHAAEAAGCDLLLDTESFDVSLGRTSEGHSYPVTPQVRALLAELADYRRQIAEQEGFR